MALTITLEPEVEARFRDEADREGVTLEQLTTQRLLEAELLFGNPMRRALARYFEM